MQYAFGEVNGKPGVWGHAVGGTGAITQAMAHGWSRQPVVEMLIHSTLDGTLMPAGQHVASLFVQYAAPQLPQDRSWDDAKDELADLVIDAVTAQWHPARRRTPDQSFSARPVLGHAETACRCRPLSVRGGRPSGRRRRRPVGQCGC